MKVFRVSCDLWAACTCVVTRLRQSGRLISGLQRVFPQSWTISIDINPSIQVNTIWGIPALPYCHNRTFSLMLTL